MFVSLFSRENFSVVTCEATLQRRDVMREGVDEGGAVMIKHFFYSSLLLSEQDEWKSSEEKKEWKKYTFCIKMQRRKHTWKNVHNLILITLLCWKIRRKTSLKLEDVPFSQLFFRKSKRMCCVQTCVSFSLFYRWHQEKKLKRAFSPWSCFVIEPI